MKTVKQVDDRPSDTVEQPALSKIGDFTQGFGKGHRLFPLFNRALYRYKPWLKSSLTFLKASLSRH